MTKKNIGIVLLLIFCLLPIHKINAQTSKIQKIIGVSTPDFIAKPIISIVTTIEKFRSETGSASENKKESIQTEIQALPKSGSNVLLMLFKYAELFFFSFLSTILMNEFVFYFSSVAIIFLIILFISHQIF
jgi:hypothetical protein